MSRVEALLEVAALELAHARLRLRENSKASRDDREINLTRVITAKAHALGLAAATMLSARLEYRYRLAGGEDFTRAPDQALRIEAELWADDKFADAYARASLLADEIRFTASTNSGGIYEACLVETERPGQGWVKI